VAVATAAICVSSAPQFGMDDGERTPRAHPRLAQDIARFDARMNDIAKSTERDMSA